ncbi:MAG: protein kinase, partial [Gemmatimonadales bacterium]
MTTKSCTSCGGQIYPTDRFCAHCGAQQEPGVSAAELARAGSAWDPVLEKLRAATAGKYEIGRVLGAGGMAAVYLGREIKLDRAVAIKVMSPGVMLQPGMIQRFHREAVTVAALNHPNIVTIYTVEETSDLYYFVMKHIAGPSLETVIRRDAPLEKPVVIAWLTQIASALSYAHKRGVIHRDIKPANILLDEEGNAVVTDFGIAKVPRQSNLTQTGMTLGTPAYMSPEQCTSKEVTAASDQYSLGIVTYEMLAGEPPFTGPSLEVMKAHVGQRPRPISAFRPHAPPELAAAVERMLEKDPRDRWPSLEEMIGSVGGRPIAHHDPLRAQLVALAMPAELRRAVTEPAAPATTTPQEPTVTPPQEPTVTPPEEPAPTPLAERLPTPAEPRAAEPVAELPEFLEPPTTQPVAALLLAPVPPAIWAGHTLQLEATPLDAGGQPLEGREVTWESSDPEVAVVARSGLLDARKPGRAVLTASCEGIFEQAAIDVVAVRVEQLRVRPSRRVMAVGHSVQLRAVIRGSDDSLLHDRPVTWSSEDPEVLEVSAEGLMTAVAEGSARVTAECEEQIGAAAVRVTAPGAPYLVGRFWWTAPAAAMALVVVWLAIRPGGPSPGAENDQPVPVQSEAVQVGGQPESSQLGPAQGTSDRVLAEAALRRAAAARDSAAAAGAQEADPAGFENLSGQLEAAEAELAAGDLFRALTLLDPLPQAFSDLAQV